MKPTNGAIAPSSTKSNPDLRSVRSDHIQPTPSLGITFGELRGLKLPAVEDIIHGLPRGYVGTLNASTNVGKSTFVRNLLIHLCTGKPFAPISASVAIRRVALIDFEDTRANLRKDLNTMCSDLIPSDKALIDENLLIVCEERFPEDTDMTLTETDHVDKLIERLAAFKPALIILETISSGFRVRNENDNAEAKNEVMAPLRRLARLTNSAVLATHHIGKAKLEEGSTQNACHKGRGASSYSDQSWLILNLEPNAKTGSVILECGKVKGDPFPNTVFKFDRAKRSLRAVEVREKMSLERLIDQLDDDTDYKTSELVELLSPLGSKRTTLRRIDDACDMDLLCNVTHGIYRKVSK